MDAAQAERLPLRQAAQRLGISKSQLSRDIRECPDLVVERRGRSVIIDVPRAKAYRAANKDPERSPSSPLSLARAEHESLKTELTRTKLREARRDLVDRATVEASGTAVFLSLRRNVERLFRRIAPEIIKMQTAKDVEHALRSAYSECLREARADFDQEMSSEE